MVFWFFYSTVNEPFVDKTRRQKTSGVQTYKSDIFDYDEVFPVIFFIRVFLRVNISMNFLNL